MPSGTLFQPQQYAFGFLFFVVKMISNVTCQQCQACMDVSQHITQPILASIAFELGSMPEKMKHNKLLYFSGHDM